MERVEPPTGYGVRDREAVERILAVEEELLTSEGIDPDWPGFLEEPESEKRGVSQTMTGRYRDSLSSPRCEPFS